MKRTPEEIADGEARTNSMGLFNTACSFQAAAIALEEQKVRSTHRDMPVYLLHLHTLELFLKAFLRAKYTAAQLRSRELGHNLPVLVEKALEMKLVIPKKDRAVIALCDLDVVFGARYIRTGYQRLPRTEDLRAICARLRTRVGGRLRRLGVKVRR